MQARFGGFWTEMWLREPEKSCTDLCVLAALSVHDFLAHSLTTGLEDMVPMPFQI